MSYIVLTEPIYVAGQECGYCHGQKEKRFANAYMQRITKLKSQSITIGCSVQRMSCEDYDDFINIGFRRSGTFLYKTDMLRNCCRYYTIRTNLSQCKFTKKLRLVTNRFIRAITDPEDYVPPLKKANAVFDINELIYREAHSSTFYTRFERSVFSTEKYELYKKYQVEVHDDSPEDITEEQFERFLCENPFDRFEREGNEEQWDMLNNWTSEGTIFTARLGPTHECYYFNGKLIAFSVMDFLPSGISSVYFVWDPDYARLSLGTISVIRELLLLDKLRLNYYYLGYYIDDCEKMQYKGQYGGELLDICNEMYFSLSELKPIIKDSRLFIMGDRKDSYDREINIWNPTIRSKKQLVNIAEELYRKPVFKASDQSVDRLKIMVDLSESNFPFVIPGLVPIPQLEKYFNDFKFESMFFTFFNMYSGEIQQNRNFAVITKKQRIAIINCIRLFGINKLSRLIVMMR